MLRLISGGVLLLGELHLGLIQLLLHLGHVGSFHLGGNGSLPLLQRALPLGHGELQPVRLFIHVAQVLVHRRIVVEAVYGLAQFGFRHVVLAHLEVNPAERIQVGSILRVQGNRAPDQRQSLVEPGARSASM